MPRLVSWNIRHGGGKQIAPIIDALAQAAPDIVVVIEYRPNRNEKAVQVGLEGFGLLHHARASVAPSVNTVLMASRDPIESEPIDWWPDADPWRMLSSSISGVRILAAYFPATAPHIANAHVPLLAQTARWQRDGRPTLLVGDLNSGSNPADTEGSRLTGGPNFVRMLEAGWTDVWRGLHPEAGEFTWYSRSKRGTFGFRLDHALTLNWPADCRITARYDHTVRERRLSDHSMLIVDW